jgi:hypothetical protein
MAQPSIQDAVEVRGSSATSATIYGLIEDVATALDNAQTAGVIVPSAHRQMKDELIDWAERLGTNLKPASTAPTFEPVAGTYSGTQSVAIASAVAGAKIYYTTNGDTPTIASTLYTAAVSVAASATLKAIAVEPGKSPSTVASAAYVIS